MPTFNRTDYLFDLPPEQIAQTPAERRDHSRLLVAAKTGKLHHRRFFELPDYLTTGDLLVLNKTKVMNARCFAVKESGGRVECFILSVQSPFDRVPVLLKPGKRMKPGMRLHFPNSGIAAELVEKGGNGKAYLAFPDQAGLLAVVDSDGQVPLPPYIKREQGPANQDGARYQTVYAADLGAVAAPTAGLHFTQALLDSLRERGVETAFVTHHVGIGTFKPLTAPDIRDHLMEPEGYRLDEKTCQRLNLAKSDRRRIIAVGTTTTRCLESNYDGLFHPGDFSTNLFIYPGYRFKAIDGLVTNFHLPGSSLILLVSALMGRSRILDLYGQAIAAGYRFYSYGDAMLLLPASNQISR